MNHPPVPDHIQSGVYILHQAFLHRSIGRKVATTLLEAGYNVYLDDKFHAPETLPSTHAQRQREIARRPIGVCILSTNSLNLDQYSTVRWLSAELELLSQHAHHIALLKISPDVSPYEHAPSILRAYLADSAENLQSAINAMIADLPASTSTDRRQNPIVPAEPSQIEADYQFEALYRQYWRLEKDGLVEQLQSILQKDPQHFGAMTIYVRVLVDQRRLAEALELTYRMEAIDKHDLWVYAHRAAILMHMGRYDESLMLYSQLLQRNPNVASLWAFRAYLNLYREDFAAALQDVQRAIDIFPHYRHFHMRGMCYLAQRDFERALADFEHVNSARPDWMMNHATWAVSLFYLGRKQEAQTVWQALLYENKLFLQLDYLADQFQWPPVIKEMAVPMLRFLNSRQWTLLS